MTITSATGRGQRFAEQTMTDTCTITRAGEPVYNPATLAYTASSTTVYSGKCRVKPRPVMDRQVQAGEQALQIWPYVVSVPMSVTGVQVDDVVTVTASADADLEGQVLVVKDVTRGTNVTARRLGCEDQNG